VAATGQSGHPLSPHYRDLTALWASGRSLAIEPVAESYRRGAIGELRLH
jgi:acyl-homoserine lactone acylase PvdQ